MKLSVIVPMGRPERAGATLASLARQSAFPSEWELILVGRCAEAMCQQHPRLPVIPVPLLQNQLPPKTRTLGVERATGTWLLFIDDDVELAPDFFAELLHLFSDQPYAAAAEPPVGAIGVRLPGRQGTFFERLVDLSNFWAQQDPQPGERPWLYSAALLVRAEAYQGAGGFNSELPNGEDVDLTRRVAAAGWILRYEPRLVAYHNHGRDSLVRMWRYFWRNGNAAQYFFQGFGAACPFSVKTAWRKAWSDLGMNLAFNRGRIPSLRRYLPWLWINYLIMETSLEWHYQQYLAHSGRFASLPAPARSDRLYVRAMRARQQGRRLRGAFLYAMAVAADFTNPVRR